MATDRLLRRLRELEWPTPAMDQPEVAAGQLWRAAWQEVACLVVILDDPVGRTVRVAAASADDFGDDTALRAETTGGLRPTVWGSLVTYIKTFTLEARVTELTAASLTAVRLVVEGHWAGQWAPITSDLDDRSIARVELSERLVQLAQAEWLPEASEAGATLAELADEAGLTTSEIAAELSITPGDARRVLQGKRELAPSELDIVTAIFGVRPQPSAVFDDELVEELDLPLHRPLLDMWARRHNTDDPAAVRRAAAGQVLALAARHRQPGGRNWNALITEVLRDG